MKFHSLKRIILLVAVFCAAFSSCVSINQEIGSNYLPEKDRYDVYSFSMPLADISLKSVDSLMSYSSSRLCVGSMKDADYGQTRRSASTSLVPVSPVNLGLNPKLRSFHFSISKDTLCYTRTSDAAILQNILVYEMDSPLDTLNTYCDYLSPEKFAGRKIVTKGHPVYDGGDSLSFNFSDEFAQKYIEAFRDSKQAKMFSDSTHLLVKQLPGIYICCDDLAAEGGRINLFSLPLNVESSSYSITGNYAELKIRSDYWNSDSTSLRKDVDTSFVFYFGASSLYSSSAVQTCCNFLSSESGKIGAAAKGMAAGELLVEGGSGLKPVIASRPIRDAFLAELESRGVDRDRVIINKATLIFNYIYDSSQWDKYNAYPAYLTPWVRVKGKNYVFYGGITDSSVSSENQGEINRSTLRYTPDITHHFQDLVQCDTLEVAENEALTARHFAERDIWMFIKSKELVKSSTSTSSSANNDYLNALMYSQYYNALYGDYGYGYGGMYGGYGGYGYGGYGYGGYGGYGSYYNNYYTYAMMNAMYGSSSSSSSEEYKVDVDILRFYDCHLASQDNSNEDLRPRLEVTYSVRRR